MKTFNILLIMLMLLISACSTKNIKQPIKKAEIISLFPRVIEGYSYIATQDYGTKASGYSARYSLNVDNHADVYIYPVPDKVKHLSHNELIVGMTERAIAEIKMYQERGIYHEFNIFNRSISDKTGMVLAKVEATFISQNLLSYTLIYLMESEGKFIKARITMPDNLNNRQHKRWDAFVNEIFSFITANIDKT